MRHYDKSLIITAIITSAIVDMLLIGGAAYLCAYKDKAAGIQYEDF